MGKLTMVLAGMAALGVGAAGCNSILGIEDHPVIPAEAASPLDAGSDAPMPIDSGHDAGQASDTGGGGDAAVDAASDAPTPCNQGDLRCSGTTPQVCTAGVWTNQTPCGGSTPVCSNGVCGSFRTTGGIRSTAPAGAGDGGVRLRSGGFELGTPTCFDGGTCVTGGIVP